MSRLIRLLYRTVLYIRKNPERLFWSAALIILFFLPETKSAVSLCVFSLFGFGPCPGCGIGHAIHYALRLDINASFQHHPLGIPAVIIIFIRIKQLIHQTKKPYET